LYKQIDSTILLKSIVFILIIFPFISHIYGAVFPFLYDYKISYISSAIILFIIIMAIKERRIVYDKNIKYFIPFLLVALAESIYSHNIIFLKYFAYLLIYFLFLRKFFFHQFIFKLYVNILVITFFILVSIFFVTLNTNFDLFSYFEIANLNYISSNAPINNWSEDYRGLIFYLLVYVPGDSSGILPIPRFYGFSREPGMYVTFILPGVFIAHYLKMKFQVFILSLGVLICSSFAGFFVCVFGIFLMFLPRYFYNRALSIFTISILLLIVFRHNIASLIGVVRVNDYVLIMDRILNNYISRAGTFSILNFLFFLEKFSYLLIIYHFYNKVKMIDARIVLVFFFSAVILINKANELISPLFLFYLLFVDYAYQKAILSNNIKFNSNFILPNN
jgi:hypothetical protein